MQFSLRLLFHSISPALSLSLSPILFLSQTLIPTRLPAPSSPNYLSLGLPSYLSATGNGFFPNPGGWRGVLTVPNKEVTVWILQKYKEEKEDR